MTNFKTTPTERKIAKRAEARAKARSKRNTSTKRKHGRATK
jgi:hypothetical protein